MEGGKKETDWSLTFNFLSNLMLQIVSFGQWRELLNRLADVSDKQYNDDLLLCYFKLYNACCNLFTSRMFLPKQISKEKVSFCPLSFNKILLPLSQQSAVTAR